MLRCLLIACALFIAACAPLAPYQPAEAVPATATNGYLDEEIAHQVFAIEVRHANVLPLFTSKAQLIGLMHDQWQRRAAELCPYGYHGDADIINATDARINAFKCTGTGCEKELLVSGIAWCHKRYSL